MKVGDKLVCIKKRKHRTFHKLYMSMFVVGDIYTIAYIDDKVIYIDKDNKCGVGYFTIFEYQNWFMTIREIRKNKLERLRNEKG